MIKRKRVGGTRTDMPTEIVEAEVIKTVLVAPVIRKIENIGKAAYIWNRGVTIYLSKKNWLLADEFIKTRSYEMCGKRLKGEMGIELGIQTIKRRLEREEVKEWMGEQMEEMGVYEGWSRERWVLRLTRHMDGRERLKQGDLFAMSLLAKYKGWGEIGIMNQNNISINFTERG